MAIERGCRGEYGGGNPKDETEKVLGPPQMYVQRFYNKERSHTRAHQESAQIPDANAVTCAGDIVWNHSLTADENAPSRLDQKQESPVSHDI